MIFFSDVYKIYRTKAGPVEALSGVSLRIDKGEFACIAGPSGSGKSTLLNLAGALDIPSRGSVRVAGWELNHLSPSQAAAFRLHNVGFIFQSYNLLPVLTAYENVEYVLLIQGVGLEERKRRVKLALSKVGLEGKMMMRADELSGGEQQRVAAARAIVAEPPLILADEPTANLDSRTGKRLIDTLHQLNKEQGVTMLFSSHDPEIIERADRVIWLKDGKVEEDRR